MKSFLKHSISSVLKTDMETTNDHLEAYPERMETTAFPERRYLKTARVFAILIFISILLNCAMAFVFMKMASMADASIFGGGQAHLYRADLFNRSIRTVEPAHVRIPAIQLLSQNIIEEYINLRFSVSPFYNEMLVRWMGDERLYLYSSEDGKMGLEGPRSAQLAKARSGIVEDVYIYSIRTGFRNLYEVVFDVFTLPKTPRGNKECLYINEDKLWLACLREKATAVQRYKALMRVSYNWHLKKREEVIKNPYQFSVTSFTLYTLPIHPNDPWMDVDHVSK